jgi:hypothetical protein
MGTDIYTVSCGDKKPWHELIPSKIKGVLKHPGPHDRLLVFAELASPDSIGKERDYFCNVSNVEFKDFYDFDPEEYFELDGKECAAFFDTHFFYLYCYDVPDLAVSAKSVSSLYIRVAKFLAVLQASNRHFLVCISQEFGARTMFFTNCSAAVSTPTNETAQPASIRPKPLEWLSAEQCEVLSLRLELLRRDYLVWRYDKDKVEYPKELFENSDKFITACHDGTLLDGASDIFGYHALRSKRQNVLSLQGLGYLCGCPDKAAKILDALKPYLDAVYDLPLPVKEDSDNE